jgi:sarcosine oxidase
VALIDAYGSASSRASSGGESRIIRMGYGSDQFYTRWAMRSLALWREFFERAGERLFCPTGVLWLASETDQYTRETLKTLRAVAVPSERLSAAELRKRYPQIVMEGVTWGLWEPQSGVLLARRAVQALVREMVQGGAEFSVAAVLPPGGAQSQRRMQHLVTARGDRIKAETFIFACGAWLPKLFPELLRNRIFPTRQEVFFFGPPPGCSAFASAAMPALIHLGDQIYSVPDLEHRGFKIAFDSHGPKFDPDKGPRIVSSETLRAIRHYLSRRFPLLKDSPLVESRVCQYENTSNGDFLIDRHPELQNVWIVGGGSGHGFKHGPALGEYVVSQIFATCQPERRFSLATKEKMRRRTVY